MKKFPDVVIKTVLNSPADKVRLTNLKEFINEYGHKCENVGRNTLSKMGKQIASRKKNHARSGDYLGRARSKAPFKTKYEAKGGAGSIPADKKYLYKKVVPKSREAVLGEIADLVAKEKKLGMIIGIIMNRRRAGTYECIHDMEHKWTSMRQPEGEKFIQCAKCGFRPIMR